MCSAYSKTCKTPIPGHIKLLFKETCKDMFKLAVHVGIAARINKVVDDLEDCKKKIEEKRTREKERTNMLRSGLRCVCS